MSEDDDDIIPLHKAESRPPLPIDVSLLKRKKADKSQGGGHRFFSGTNNDEYIVAEELLSEDELLGGQDEENQEEAAQASKRQRVQESTIREVIAESRLRTKRRARAKLTRDEKRLAVVLRKKSLTNADLQARYHNDQDSLITIGVLSPYESFVNETLGPSPPRRECFACMKGVGLARIAPRAIAHLQMQIKEALGTQEIWMACFHIELNFDEEIRIPSNAGRAKEEGEIQPWTARSIFDHFCEHTMEPSFVLHKQIKMCQLDLDIASGPGHYRVPKEVYASGREIEIADLIIDDKRHKQILDLRKQLVWLLSQVPEKMMFSNANFNLHTTPQHVIVPKASAKEVIRKESIFSKTDLTEKTHYKI